jgi:hypothetical protein
MTDIADYADLVEERREQVADEPPASPWDGMSLPAVFAHLVSQGETPEVAADIVDGIMITRMNGKANGRKA